MPKASIQKKIYVHFASSYRHGQPYFTYKGGRADTYQRQVLSVDPTQVEVPDWAICFQFHHGFLAPGTLVSQAVNFSLVYHLSGRHGRIVSLEEVGQMAKEAEEEHRRSRQHGSYPFYGEYFRMREQKVSQALLDPHPHPDPNLPWWWQEFCFLKEGEYVFLPPR